MSSYETLRRQSRTLESLLDAKLTSYTALASSISRGQDIETGGSSERWKDLESEVEGLLDKLRETHEEMASLLNDPELPPSQSMMHAVQRHRDALQDYSRDFNRTRANVKSALEKNNLLSNVRNDIESYKAARTSATDSLLAERGRIDSSHHMTDDIIGQAYETRSDLNRQRTSIGGINTRMSGVLNTIPGINSLVGMIQSRRRRDALILGCVIGFCTILLFGYWTR